MTNLDIDLDDPNMPEQMRAYLMEKLLAQAPQEPHAEARMKPIVFTPHSGPSTWKDHPLQGGLGSVKVFPAEQELSQQVAKLRGLIP